MNPINFKEANIPFCAPKDLAESQCATIKGFCGVVQGGSCDGVTIAVVAYRPTPEELDAINNGAPIYLSCLGGLPPHFLTTDFHTATHPA